MSDLVVSKTSVREGSKKSGFFEVQVNSILQFTYYLSKEKTVFVVSRWQESGIKTSRGMCALGFREQPVPQYLQITLPILPKS